eukprot:scaffold9699_cov278-Ochromonas_danica.AAC.1
MTYRHAESSVSARQREPWPSYRPSVSGGGPVPGCPGWSRRRTACRPRRGAAGRTRAGTAAFAPATGRAAGRLPGRGAGTPRRAAGCRPPPARSLSCGCRSRPAPS